ncbi:MAG: DUF2029 domain-containing protein [Promethearchaeota archaeon]|nr:MAG: DUF2029 domain-containing protein [Candidatus Lokiarchaeota archaeon]
MMPVNEKDEYPLHHLFICVIIVISIALITYRIMFNYFSFPRIILDSKDYDYFLFIKGMDNGLVNFYEPIEGYDWPPYYLYFWYFLFFPFYLLPVDIGVYIWDILRLVMGIYIMNEAPKIFKNQVDLLVFYALSTVSYALDAYYNNCNFLITFFVFLSYVSLEKDKMWLSGIFFTLATFKINAILFLPLLLVIRKIEVKDLKYYLTPFFLACIPYIIFPDYFLQMIRNWGHSDDYVQGIFVLDSILWKALQPTHLMIISLFLIIFCENIENVKRKHQFKAFILPILIAYYIYLTMIVFLFPLMGLKF